MRLPGTLLARTVATIGVLLIVSLVAWLTLFTLAEREPRAQQTATRLAGLVTLTRAALLAAQPERRQALLEELSQREGIRIVPLAPEELTLAPPERPFLKLVWRELQAQLGEGTLLVGDEFDDEALWVSFQLGPDDYWLVLPRPPHREGIPWQWIGWGALTLLLAFGGGWVLVARINRPLREAAAGAERVGQGVFDARLDENGPAEIASLARAFNAMSANLADLESNRALMLAGVAHDLRTPLARLRLAVEMAVGDARERAAMTEDLEDIDALARQFMEFARPPQADACIETDVDALCAELAESFGTRGAPVALTGSTGVATLPADGLRRALSNLLENAHRYGAPPVEMDLAHDDGTVSITVSDRGPGLADAELEAAKRPFYRGNAARTGAQGTGLGLAIVERFAKRNGGSLTLRNRKNRGLAAQLSLPARAPQGSPAPAPRRP